MLLYLFCNKSHYENVPFEIPKSWCWTTLGELFDIVSAKRVLQSDWQRTGIPFYRAREIVRLSYEGYVDNDLFITEEHYNNLKKSYGVPEPSDIMLSAVGTIGRAHVVRNNDVFYYKDASVLCLRNVYHLNSEFIKWILSSDLLQNQMYENSKGTTVDTITIEKANNYFLPLPPIDEQYRIVKLLCKWNAYINDINKNKEVILNNIRTCKSKILDLAISGKLVSQDPNDEPAIELLKRINPDFEPCDNSHYENIEFDIPKNWVWATIGDIFEHNTGKALNASNPNGTMLDYITTSNLYWDRFELSIIKQMSFTESEIERCIVRKGDLLICEGGDVGRAAIWDYDYNIMIQNHIHRLRGKVDICTRYFFYLFMHYKLHNLIGGKGVAIQGLSSRDLHNLIIPIPSLKEQYDIASSIDLYFSKLDMITAEL